MVAHVPAGSGHQRAAQAMVAALATLRPTPQVFLINALEGMDAWYRWLFTRGYSQMIQRFPWAWGFLYHLTDARSFFQGVQSLHRRNNSLHGKKLETILLDLNPGVILGTHFFPMEVAGNLKVQGKLTAKLFTVITDYIPHALWVANGIDRYLVGAQKTQEYLLGRGVPENGVSVTGVPIDPKFSDKTDRNSLGRGLGIDPASFTILIASGGSGTGPLLELVKRLGKDDSLQLLVVAGNNPLLFQSLERLRPQIRSPLTIYGFIQNMDELMEVSDVMVTKAGGLTCAEAMAKGLPLIFVSSIPGQESRNASVLAQWGCALTAEHPREVPLLIENLKKNRQQREAMSQKARAHALPQAALEIARMAVG